MSDFAETFGGAGYLLRERVVGCETKNPLFGTLRPGSNSLKERFMCYLEGARLRVENGPVLKYTKCDAGPRLQGDHPFNDRPFRLPFKLYFARRAKWGSVSAFVEIEPISPPPTLSRAYLLTLPQLGCLTAGRKWGLSIR